MTGVALPGYEEIPGFILREPLEPVDEKSIGVLRRLLVTHIDVVR